jgi:hypothetical protein
MTQPIQPACRLEFDHLGAITDAVTAITIDPVRSIFFYTIPFLGAWVAWHSALRIGDPLQNLLISEEAKIAAIDQVNQLKTLAGIDRDIAVYTSDNYTCASFGGSCSFMAPAISIPRGFLTTPGDPLFPTRPDIVQPPIAEHWRYNQDQSLFFIAREVINIKSNNTLIRIAVKIIFVAALFFIYALSIPLLGTIGLIAAAIALHMILERCLKNHLDIDATLLLKKYFYQQALAGREENDLDPAEREPLLAQAEERAIAAGRQAIEKLIAQNLERRESNTLCRLYVTPQGNNLLDVHSPFLTNRLYHFNSYFR